MTESGQQGSSRKNEMGNQGDKEQVGQFAGSGKSPEKHGKPAVSGWDRYRKPAARDIDLIPVSTQTSGTASANGMASANGTASANGMASANGTAAVLAESHENPDVLPAPIDSAGAASPEPGGLSRNPDSPPPDGKHPKKKPSHWHFLLPLSAILLILLLIYGMWRFFWSPEPISGTVVAQAVAGLLSPDDKGEAIRAVRVKETDIKPFPLLAAKPDIGPVVSPSAINLLVMARDVEANLYDTLLIVSLDPDNGRIRLLNIPRDLYVDYSSKAVALIRKKLPNINSDPALRKINAAHKLGKLIKYREGNLRFGSPDYDFTADIIEEMFSLSIDDFIYIYPESFKKIVDEFGGVRVDVPYSMRYSDPTQDLRIDLQSGEQLLDGYKAEGFVRFRKGYNGKGKWFEIGDLGRKENQNLFVKAFMEQNLTLGKMGKIISLANRYTEFMETSLTGVAKIGDYAQLGTNLITKKFVTESVVLETRYQKIFGHEQFVIGAGVKNAKSGAEAGTVESGSGKDKPSDVKPAEATPIPAEGTTEGGIQVPDPAASPDASPAASETALPVESPSPEASGTPEASAVPDASANPEATPNPEAPAVPDASPTPLASEPPAASATPAPSVVSAP